MKAARKIKASNKLSIRGKHNSSKMHRMIPWESTLERDFIKLLDFDPAVIYFEFQPKQIDYVFQGKKRKYYPDFLVVKRDMRQYIYEVKAFDKIEDETNKIKFQVGKKYCHEKNMKYVVVTEKDIRKGFLIENLDILSEVRQESTSWKVKQKIIKALMDLGGKASIKGLKSTLKDISEADVENNLFHLIYSHQLSADLISTLVKDDSIIEREGN